MKNWYRRHRRTINTVALVLCVVFVLGICLNAIGTFDGVKEKLKEETLNEANILKVDDYEDVSGEYSGVSVKVLKDGSIKLDGTATEDVTILLSENVNGYGLMTFAALDMGDEADHSYICVGTKSTSTVSTIYGKTSNTSSVTFSANTASPVIALVISSGDSFDEITIRPVLTYGVFAQTFYTVV